MASTWPAAFDNSFPGYPYADNVEFILANYANSWISAIQALETGIGYGQGSVAANPLYSVQFNKVFQTLTQRIASLEAYVAANSVQLDESLADVQPVAATASAGNSGLGSDAKHVHVGVTSFNGRSGVITTTVADVTKPFTAAGQLLVGTGNGTGELFPKGSSGQLLQVGGADPSGLQWASGGWNSGDLRFTSAVSFDSTAWLQANGSAVPRSSWPALLTATTLTTTGTSTNGLNTVSGMTASVVSRMWPGMPIEGPGIALNTFVFTIGTTSITMTQNAGVGAGAGTFTTFPHGNGNGTTTFNVADMRGRSPIGVDWDRTGPNNNLQPWWFMGAFGGELNHILQLGEGPQHFHGGTTAIENNPHLHVGNTTGDSTLHGHLAPFGEFICTTATGAFVIPNAGTVGGQRCDFGRGTDGVFGGGNDTRFADVPHNHGYSSGGNNNDHGHPFGTDNGGCVSTPHNNMHPYYAGLWLVKT